MGQVKKTVTELRCNQCKHQWTARAAKVSQRCPKCHTRRWDK